jgi:hypothetical protein
LSGADGATGLSAENRLRLTHVEIGAYAHLFGYVEEFIAPKVLSLARDYEIDNRDVFDALVNFAAEQAHRRRAPAHGGHRVVHPVALPHRVQG